MANNCCYDMRITGRKENVNEFIRMMKWEDEYAICGLGRVFSCYSHEPEVIEGDIVYVDVFGDCAWSVSTAMMARAGREHSLESETERLGIIVEVYSSEPGCCFQEHYLINKGWIEIDECVDYEEHWVEEFDSIEAYNEEFDTNFTEDMIDENGNVCIGGFGDDYGYFQSFEAVDFNYCVKGE